MRKAFTIVFTVSILNFSAFAQNSDVLSQSNDLLVKGNPNAAFDLLYKESTSNDSKVLYQLALYHQQGVGTSKNDSVANYYFSKASELGYVDAKKILAYRYMDGIGCKVDKEKAFYEFKSCSNINSECMLNYINCINEGIGTKQDLKYALEVAQKYILNNLSTSDIYTAEVAYFLAENNFSSKDSMQALKWILIANEYSENFKHNNTLKINYNLISKNISKENMQSIENELKTVFNKSELKLSNFH